MIYSLPYNKAVMDLLPPTATSDQIQRFLDRIKEGLTTAGYVIGPAGVYIGPGPGEIVVDADRDPSVQWMNFTPPAQSNAEKNAAAQITQLQNLIPSLVAGTASAAATQKAVAWLLTQMLPPVNSG